MAELISRRDFLLGTLGLGTVALGGADVAFANRTGKPTYELTPNILNTLDEVAFTSAGDINQRRGGFDHIFDDSYQAYRPELNPEAIAKSLIYLSYLDGGLDEVEKVYQLVSQRKVVFGTNYYSDPNYNAETNFSGDPVLPIRIDLNPKLLSEYMKGLPEPLYDETLWHELYHIIQEARNPKLNQIIYSAKPVVIGIGTFAIGLSNGKLVYNLLQTSGHNTYLNEEARNRRNSLAFLAGSTVGLVSSLLSLTAFKALGSIFWPQELQAYLQINGQLWDNDKEHIGYLASRLPQSLRGQMFQFTPLK